MNIDSTEEANLIEMNKWSSMRIMWISEKKICCQCFVDTYLFNVHIIVDNLIIDVCWSLLMLSVVQIAFYVKPQNC